MKVRRKVAVYLDYAIRLPNFIASFEAFKEELFSDKDIDVDTEDELLGEDVRMFWREEMKKQEVEDFYFKVKLPAFDMDLKGKDLSVYFFDKEHYRKFFDEYSVNLYIDAKVINQQDIDIINIAQEQLFDIVLVDNYQSKRKKGNTFFYLSKIRIYPQQVMFLGEGQMLNKDNYFGIWDPNTDINLTNGQNDQSFMNFFKDLEQQQKILDNGCI